MNFNRLCIIALLFFAVHLSLGEQQQHSDTKLKRKRYGIKRKQVLHPEMGRKRVKKPALSINPTLEGLSRNETRERDSRFLSVFTVVKFQNQACAAASGDNGTCLTSAECRERGGVANGACANGFGICCVSTVSEEAAAAAFLSPPTKLSIRRRSRINQRT